MAIKILHGADFHMDSPFDTLPDDKAVIRRREQRALLDRLVQLVHSEEIQLVLLAGDLLDSTLSYYETSSALTEALAAMAVPVFIAPGNHDFYSERSPYATARFSDNVHIFRSPRIECIPLPELNARVWGAGFNAPQAPALLENFRLDSAGMTEIMVIHGDMGQSTYNAISEADIAQSGLDYLALGHVHSFSGVKTAGHTAYAYPGCPEGRGFDETGTKGVIVGTVDKNRCDLHFTPLCGRAYRIMEVSLTDAETPEQAVAAALPIEPSPDIVRILLTGETNHSVDTTRLASAFADRFFHLTIRDKTTPRRDIWADMDSDTLKGLFLRKLRAQYDAAEGDTRETVLRAVRYGLAALENREECQS